MDFFEAVKKRHSYRGQYETTPISEENLTKILDAGIRAPSGTNAQTTSFYLVTNPLLIQEIAAKYTYNKANVATAPALIVVATKKVLMKYAGSEGTFYEIEDYAAAVQNILLAVTALGYASLWMDGETKVNGTDKAIAKLLDIPKNLTVRTILPIGIPLVTRNQTHRKPFDERVTWIK